MNFTQMQERLRQELLRRIQRGTLSASLLSRQSGFALPHVSNFLHRKRQMSLEALDRVLQSQHLTVSDLLPSAAQFAVLGPMEEAAIPVVSHATAIFEPYVRAGAVQSFVHPPAGLLQSLKSRVSGSRRAWQRFVAVRVRAADVTAMEPLLLADSTVLLDRHYTSHVSYRANRPNLYAVRQGTFLSVRYVEFVAGLMILRPHNVSAPLEVANVEPGGTQNDLLAGRVALILNET